LLREPPALLEVMIKQMEMGCGMD